MPTLDVIARLENLRRELPGLKLYGLLDGAQYLKQTKQQFSLETGCVALFAGTPDAALAFAGPWLIDVEAVDPGLVNELAELERTAFAVSWLIAYQDLGGLAQILRLHMDIEMPDGRKALLRFWDPRVLAGLAEILNADQRREFFGHIFEWHLLLDQKKRVRIGRRDV